MIIKASATIRQNYNEISDLCKKTKEPIYLTKNGEGDLVVMDIQAYCQREKMLRLREELLSVEEERLSGKAGYSVDELEQYLASVVEGVGHDRK
ncbi:type II toxin-antitoxin system Phd/YefM family antitoxin [uncultured Phascolarctobacterium sp.]|uniref:type II toxin-antitoxin system Phd/YefM family antitoxin n=1 Tax=uncultured Phascolarctobacterium sp. TaxID=512296 RepID=UPI0025D465AA|nr:type II toxin-antitoxin system Phd/YefM family antitoxin [uncultured Phascolarctobacterium sp.]